MNCECGNKMFKRSVFNDNTVFECLKCGIRKKKTLNKYLLK